MRLAGRRIRLCGRAINGLLSRREGGHLTSFLSYMVYAQRPSPMGLTLRTENRFGVWGKKVIESFFFFNYHQFLYKIAFLEICPDHRNESRHDTWMPVKPDHRSKAFSRFLSPGAIQESGIREDTSYVASISIDLPPFWSVRSYDGQIFRSACLPSLIPRPTTVRLTNSKLILGTRLFFGEREGWVAAALPGDLSSWTPGERRAHPDLSVTIEPWEPGPWAPR